MGQHIGEGEVTQGGPRIALQNMVGGRNVWMRTLLVLLW